MTYRYYVIYQHAGNVGFCFIARETPLNSEEAIMETHRRLESDLGHRVVILDWKRID